MTPYPAPSRPARVLVVEDEPMFQDLTKAILSIGRHKVEVAPNAFLALQLLGQSSFDCILVDYHLPEMDGYAFARLVKTMTRDRNETPLLVAVTGDREGLALRRGSDALFHAILPKPVSAKLLLEMVATSMEPEGTGKLLGAAEAFVANPDDTTAVAASRAFWRTAGLSDRPRMATWPEPTPEQARALALCFDASPLDGAQVLVVLDDASPDRILGGLGPHALLLPTISVNKVVSPFVDGEFSLLDRLCWSRLAMLIGETARRSRTIPADILLSADPIDRIAAFLHLRSRAWPADDDLAKLGLPIPECPLAEARTRVELRLGQMSGTSAASPESRSDARQPVPEGAKPRHDVIPSTSSLLEARMPEPETMPMPMPIDARKPDAGSEPGGPRSGRILLVEASDLFAEILSSLLRSARHDVTIAANADEAAAAIEGGHVDLVLAGLELWQGEQRLRDAFARMPGARSLLLTIPSDSPDGLADPYRPSGTLERPVKPKAVLDCIRRLLDSRGDALRFEQAVFDELAGEVGSETASRLWHRLMDRLDLSSGKPLGQSREAWQAEAHNLKAAGTLGFTRLAKACAELEAACKAGADIGTGIDRVTSARAAALEVLRARAPDRLARTGS